MGSTSYYFCITGHPSVTEVSDLCLSYVEQQNFISQDTVLLHKQILQMFQKTWKALGWKPTVWIHWMCAHSCFVLEKYKTIYGFTSIPVEYRHQKFKKGHANFFSRLEPRKSFVQY